MLALTIFRIPKGNANPWRKVWEKLIKWGDSLTNENRIDRCGQTRCDPGPRDQLGQDVREANAEVQS
jgi:hypothetical protein